MIQIFILGSSSAYGVGDENGGWGELIKQHLHRKMYARGGVGEKYEVYNFAKSGATINFVLKTFPDQIKQYGREGESICILSIGGNNTKAEDRPENFVSTINEFTSEIKKLLLLLKNKCTKVVVLGYSPVDESKTNPKPNPFTGGKSYFTNARRQQFGKILKRLCEKMNVIFVDSDISDEEWKRKYLAGDGLHPNSRGHKDIYLSILKYIGAL